jgi:hypothetical protein
VITTAKPSRGNVSKATKKGGNQKQPARKGVASQIARQPKRPIFAGVRQIDVDPDSLDACMRVIEWEIRQRHPAAAHAALDRLIAECGCAPEVLRPESPLSMLQTVFGETVGLNQRELNELEANGFLNLCSFMAANESDFNDLDNFGFLTVQKMLNLQNEVLILIQKQEAQEREAVELC